MPVGQIKKFLDDQGVKYVIVEHSPAYTAQEIAESIHISGKHFAKTVAIKVDDDLALAVVPATQQVDLGRLAQSVGAESVALASEEEFRDRFPGCELGAMPPFGNLFGMETFVSPKLTTATEIAFNAGTHTEVMLLRYGDFEQLVKPAVVHC